MRFAYALLTYVLLPVYAAYWLLRAIMNRSYRAQFPQRFGAGYPRPGAGCIWVHAVSVGEVQASVPLVRTLLSVFPERQLLMTTVTPTGRERVRLLFGHDVLHSFIPFDTPAGVRSFFDAVSPRVALIMETEIWPSLYGECGRRGIPLVLVSARISPKSQVHYRRFLPLFRETLSHGIVIAAQSESDAERFRSLGAPPERITVTGNIKFDIEVADEVVTNGARFRRDNFDSRPVWIAASTHDGEEEQVLDAHRKVRERFPDAILLLVPRHPERFSAVRSKLHRQHFRFVARTDGERCTAETEIFLVDTMGEVPMFYAASDIAYVGGTLVPVGGHNRLEPAALGLPVVTGPHRFNTQDIADMFERAGAAVRISDSGELATEVSSWMTNTQRARAIGARGRELVVQNRGALERLLELIRPLLAR